MNSVIQQAAEKGNVSHLYLVDASQTFCGVIYLKDLIITREGTPLSEIVTISYP